MRIGSFISHGEEYVIISCDEGESYVAYSPECSFHCKHTVIMCTRINDAVKYANELGLWAGTYKTEEFEKVCERVIEV